MTSLEEAEAWCRDLLALGRAYLKKKAPFIADTLLGLVPVFEPGCGTMAVTKGLVLYIDPLWAVQEPAFRLQGERGEDLGHAVMGGCLYHECWHVLRRFERLDALGDPETANLAADIAINQDLREAGFLLPPWVAYPENYGFPTGLTTEQYFALLKKKQQPKSGQGQGQGQSQGQEQDADGSGKSSSKSGKGKAKKKKGAGAPAPGPCAGKCGGIAGNKGKQDALEDRLDQEHGRSKADVERIKRTSYSRIKEHIKQHGCGTAPGFSSETLAQEEDKQSQVDWRLELQHVLRFATGQVQSGDEDYSLRMPNIQAMVLGVIRPGLMQQKCEVFFVRDTSGSMGTEELLHANAETVAVMRQLDLEEVWHLDVDTVAHGEPKRVSVHDIPRLEAKGRGGTDFRPAFALLDKMNPRPDLVVYLTDGDGPAPKEPPRGVVVVWCIVPTPYGRRPAKWGHLVLASNDRRLRAPYLDED